MQKFVRDTLQKHGFHPYFAHLYTSHTIPPLYEDVANDPLQALPFLDQLLSRGGGLDGLV